MIELNEASLPKQTRLRIESEALGADQATLLKLNSQCVEDEAKAIARSIERVFAAGNYVIFRHSRIVEERVELPSWVNDVVNDLMPSTRPKLFIISQLPVLPERRNTCRESLTAQRVSTIDEHQLTEFCHQLIGYFDQNPGRWNDEEIGKIVRASGGNIGFLVSLVRSASRIEDFDQIDEMVEADDRTMAASITLYVRWAFSQLREFEDEQRALLFLNDVSPCDMVDIERAVAPTRPVLRVLGKLLEFGLVERESDNLYRLTPLLSHRLSRDLVRPDLLNWLRGALVEFSKNPTEMDVEGHEYVRIESRIQASILSDDDQLPASIKQFVSAAHWFQAGIRLYHARRREPAYRILKKAYAKRQEFAAASRVELTRYFCLSATQNRKYREAEACIDLLEGVFQTKEMAAFLRADLLEQKRQFVPAIKEYERSLELNRGKHTRLERTYRPIIRCILSSPRPDFSLAERYALDWLDLRETVFSRMALARVYLHWKYQGVEHQRDVPDDIENRFQDALSDLEDHPGVGSAHFEIKAEEARFSGDFHEAVAYMDKAIEADPRFELRSTRWRLMASSGDEDLALKVISELNGARYDSRYQGNWSPFLPILVETYAISLRRAGKSYGSLNTFAPELKSDEIGAIVARVNRRH